MADESILKNLGHINFLQEYLKVKSEFENKLEWKYRDWEENGQLNSDMHRLVKRSKHWFKSLKEVQNDKLLVITLFKEGFQSRIDTKEVLFSFKKQFGMSGLQGFSETKNNTFIVLAFQTRILRDFAAKNFCVVGDSIVVNSDWIINDFPIDIRVLWLPPIIDVTVVHAELSKYINLVNLFAETLDLNDGDILPTGKFLGKLKKKDNIALDDIPHVITFEGYQSLVIIPKRQPLCLNCNALGHISHKCPIPFCQICQKRLPIGHTCGEISKIFSFADAVKSVKLSSNISHGKSKHTTKIDDNRKEEEQGNMESSHATPLSVKEDGDTTNQNIPQINSIPGMSTFDLSDTEEHQSRNDSDKMEYQVVTYKRNRDQLEVPEDNSKTNVKSMNTYSKRGSSKQMDNKQKDLFDRAKNL